ncbi:hypothetical protein AB0B40_17730 [Streptomyces sp. NPDC042638]|uniref:hypothetical protein n=1 Tax=Streptomyces sp. NPDC042638 TaxID=3154333 RepID=UPI0034060AEC
MWVELFGGAAVGFLGGLTTAWRIVAKGVALAWLEDLRDQVKVRKVERRKKQAIRHARLDRELAADAEAAEAERQRLALAAEAESKRVRRAHSELKKTLPLANDAVRTYTNSIFVGALEMTSRSYPHTAAEANAEREKYGQHRAVVAQLRRQVEKLSGLGVVETDCRITDWDEASPVDLQRLAASIDKAAKDYALKL